VNEVVASASRAGAVNDSRGVLSFALKSVF